MSGMFGQVTPVAVPDFGATLARAQGMQANRLAMLAQQRQMANEDALQGFFAQNGAGFGSADPQQRMNLLAQLAAQPGGARMALPMMQGLREEMEWSGAGQQPAAQGSAPVITPAASGAGGGVRTGAAIQVPANLDDADILTRTILGEAANQGEEGMRAVAHVTRNRMRQTNSGVRDVVLAPNQYEPWGSRRQELLAIQTTDPRYIAARRIAEAALADQSQDPTGGATHFLNPDLQRQLGRQQPSWAPEGQGQRIGAHVFYRPGGGVVTGGDTIPAQAGAPTRPAAGAAPGGLPEVPGFDMNRVRRAINLPNNAAAQRYLQTYMSAAGLVRRGESEPLERIRDRDGNETLVPRTQAAGMVSAPSPREAPGAYGQDRVGRATQYIEELGPIVARGEATPEQLQRYGTSVTTYQNRVSENGTLVSQPLPPNVPGLDWVARRYPNFQFNGAQAPGQAAGATVTPVQAGAAPTMGDAVPAAPTLPAPGGTPSLPGAGGGVQREGNAMESGTRRQIEEAAVGSQERISRLTNIERSYDPQQQTYGARWSNMWAALRERSGAQLSPQERQRLTQYTQGRAAALENLNNTIKETTGAAMTEGEAARITATMPNPGTGLFDGDSPTEFQAKLQRAINATRNAIVRQNYALARGLNPTQTGIELDAIPRLYEQRGREIEAELRQGSPDADAAQLRQQVRARLRQEFGI